MLSLSIITYLIRVLFIVLNFQILNLIVKTLYLCVLIHINTIDNLSHLSIFIIINTNCF
jgi:hypothetical protein